MTVAQNGSVALPAPHGGRLTERLVAADRAEVARLLADGYRTQRG